MYLYIIVESPQDNLTHFTIHATMFNLVSWQELRDYVIWLKSSRSLSDRTINHCISQLRCFLFMFFINHGMRLSCLCASLTYIFLLSQKDTFTFISTMLYLKQKTMLAVMYSTDLRVGELCALRYEDIQRQTMHIHIKHSKALCDRYAILSTMALDLLTQYWYEYDRPMGWLFPKQIKKDSPLPIETFYQSRHIHAHERRLGWEQKTKLPLLLPQIWHTSLREWH
jgi:site-specific recombinase XerD